MHDMLRGIKAVIFDMDGSLVDSMWVWNEVDIEYLRRHNIPMPEGLQREVDGMNFSEVAGYFKEKFKIEDPLEAIKDEWNQMARDKYAYEVSLKEGVLEFLKECRKRKVLVGLATSNSMELAESMMIGHDIQNYFQYVLTGSEVGNSKPAPDIYLTVAAKLGIVPMECLVFEDVLPGIQSGKSAGMRVCAVEDLYSLADKEAKINLADYYISSYSGLWE